METEIILGDVTVTLQDRLTITQDSDIVWMNITEAIQLRNFLNQLNLGEEK